ncbi:hypothetical protein, partial [Dialister sp.]|uniref:hypothetical protein n=1 Tax=Dialister sp. TaxID=1955814 RepID=UPI003F0451D9
QGSLGNHKGIFFCFYYTKENDKYCHIKESSARQAENSLPCGLRDQQIALTFFTQHRDADENRKPCKNFMTMHVMETLMQPDPMKETVLPLHQSIPFHFPLTSR